MAERYNEFLILCLSLSKITAHFLHFPSHWAFHSSWTTSWRAIDIARCFNSRKVFLALSFNPLGANHV